MKLIEKISQLYFMLIRFNVTNFLSFKDETEFNMLAGSPRSKKEHVYHQKGIDFMRAAALYGANGAGKSNLVKALSFLQGLVLGTESTQYNKHFKLNAMCRHEPSIFEIEFIEQGILFAYRVSIFESKIVEESLYDINENKEDKILFERKTKVIEGAVIKISEEYEKTTKDKILIELYEEKLLKNNELFLSKIHKDDIDFDKLKVAYKWFSNLYIVYPDTQLDTGAFSLSEMDGAFKFTKKIISSLDTGVVSLDFEEFDIEEFLGEDEKDLQESIIKELKHEPYVKMLDGNGKRIIARKKDNKVIICRMITKHETKDSFNKLMKFEIEEESDGTQRLFDIIPYIYEAITENKVCIIDEINRSIHPTITKKLIKLFMDTKETKGQLIFSTHEAQLLDLNIFRQDEIWFAEKNKSGATTLYPLSDFNVRSDLVLKNGYLNGRFGAIPFLGNLKELNWEEGSDNG